MWRNKAFYIMMVLPIIWYIIFCYTPMFGIIIAFQKYSPSKGFLRSEWVGLTHFKVLFTSHDFPMVMKNTVIISLLRLVWGFPAPIIFSLLINEVRAGRFKKITQSISYMPHFMSWVIMGGLIAAMFSKYGPINQLTAFLFGSDPVLYMQSKAHIRTLLVSKAIWKEVGWGTLIYLAAIASVDMEQYEAAVIDGAGRFKQALYVTLPAIVPTIIIIFILQIGGILNAGFEQILMIGGYGGGTATLNPMIRPLIEIIDTYVYKMGIVQGNYSFSSAAGLFKSVVGMCLVLFSNSIARKSGETSLL